MSRPPGSVTTPAPVLGAAYPSREALEKACLLHSRSSPTESFQMHISALSSTEGSNFVRFRCTHGEPGCTFSVSAQRSFSALGTSIWRVTDAQLTHSHPPGSPPPPQRSTSVKSLPVHNETLSRYVGASQSSVSPALSARRPSALPTLSSVSRDPEGASHHQHQRSSLVPQLDTTRRTAVLGPMSPSQILVSSPEDMQAARAPVIKKLSIRVPEETDEEVEPRKFVPAPQVGQVYANRESFKDACQAHGESSRPKFAFATVGSNNSCRRPFVMYACRHNGGAGHKRILGCPYYLRVEVKDPDKPEGDWIVTEACYEHARHQVPSPPLRRPTWTTHVPPVQKRKRGRPMKSSSDRRTSVPTQHGDPDVSDSSESGVEDAIRFSKKLQAAPSREVQSAWARIAAKSRKEESIGKTPTIDTKQTLEHFICNIHPLLAGGVARDMEVTLVQAGVSDMSSLSTLSSSEVLIIIEKAGYKSAQLAVLRSRLPQHLSPTPAAALARSTATGTLETIADALYAMLPSLFARGGNSARKTTAALHDAGLENVKALQSLSPMELLDVLIGVDELSLVEKVVVSSRASLIK